MAHNSGLLGSQKTMESISSLFYFPKMKQRVRQHVRCCHKCQITSPMQKNERQPLQPIEPMATHAFDDITIDILGGCLPRTKAGNKYLLVIVCNLSKFIHAIPIRDLKSETIADKLIDNFCTWFNPTTIRCDNIMGFRSELFTTLCAKLGIDTRYSAPFHFISHGAVERANRTNESLIKTRSSKSNRLRQIFVSFIICNKRCPKFFNQNFAKRNGIWT